MIVDAHTHISFNPETVATVPGLLAAMDQAGIDKALVFAAHIFDCGTEKLLDAIQDHRDRLCAIGSTTQGRLLEDEWSEINRWFREGAIHGLKLYTGYEHFYPSDRRFSGVLDLCEKYNRPVIFHSGDTFCKHKQAKLKYAHPLHIDDLATDRPNLKIVIAHLGFPWHRDAAEVVYKNQNVYADCSGFVYGKFTEADKLRFARVMAEFVDIAGNDDKILFGTDWPISDPSSYVEVLRDLAVKSSVITQKLFALEPI